jgi:hypothetical protein
MAFNHRPIYLQCAMNYGIWSDVNTPPTTFQGPINITKLELTSITQEYDDLISNMDGSFGEALASVATPTDPAAISMEFNSMPKELLALVLGADQSALTQAATPVVDEAITTVLNVWVPLTKQFLNSSVPLVMTDTASPPNTISTSHYSVDYVTGMVMATNVAAVGNMEVDYTPRALAASETYKAGKAKSSYLKMVGHATEKVSGHRGILIVHQALVSNSSAYDWVAGSYASGTLEGKLITPGTEDSPYEFLYAPE